MRVKQLRLLTPHVYGVSDLKITAYLTLDFIVRHIL
jgi:hypothetical protein